MKLEQDRPSKSVHLYIFVILLAAVVVACLVFFTGMMDSFKSGALIPVISVLGVLLFLSMMFSILSSVTTIRDLFVRNSEDYEKIGEQLDKTRTILQEINKNTRLSETAKTIAYRDSDRRSLRSAVIEKLQKQDFETTFEIIEEISLSIGYEKLGQKLYSEATKYRNATDAERLTQVIAHIEKLFEGFQWLKASSLIERLIKADPGNEKIESLRQQLRDKKQDRKNALLAAWDEAVRRQDTDNSLEVLSELDLYLTPNEGLALQKTAREVFKNKLHSLGAQFSMQVSQGQWANCLSTGRQIIRDFPNSRISEEIRQKIDIIQQRAHEQNG